MDSTLIRGDVNELRCILDFQSRGFYCSIPFSGSCHYDVVVDINNKLYRIQCKSSTFHEEDGALRMYATKATTNTKGTKYSCYSDEEIDFFYTSWNEYSFLIPCKEVSTAKYLRIKYPKNGIQETMSIAADYLIDNVISAIINNIDIIKYRDNRFISWTNEEDEHVWTSHELHSIYSDRQITYIKESIAKNKMAYNYHWRYKEFPEL